MSQLNQSQGVTADSFGFENTCLILPWLKIQKSKQKQKRFSDCVAQIIVNPREIVRNQQTISCLDSSLGISYKVLSLNVCNN